MSGLGVAPDESIGDGIRKRTGTGDMPNYAGYEQPTMTPTATTTTAPDPVDRAARDRIASELDETLFVEAGAGSGKTTMLVARIVALLAGGRAEMGGLAAITFTEAAAAELRERVRQALQEAAQDPADDADSGGLESGQAQAADSGGADSGKAARTDEERALCRRALREMDAAAIQTLHSFAMALLRERALEAGLPPTFEVSTEIEADIQFDDAWRQWLDGALDSDILGPVILRALGLGLRLDDLRKVAASLHQNYDLAICPFTDIALDWPGGAADNGASDNTSTPGAGAAADTRLGDSAIPGNAAADDGGAAQFAVAPDAGVIRRLAGAGAEIDRLLPLSRLGDADPLYAHANGLMSTLFQQLRSLEETGEDTGNAAGEDYAAGDDSNTGAGNAANAAVNLLARSGRLSAGRRGRQADWADDPATRVNGCKLLKELLSDLEEERLAELARLRQAALLPLLESLRRFVIQLAEERKAEGRAEFHDLLVWARDLLRESASARRHFRQRFTHLLIDEFQDTDPIQAEIAFYLSGPPDSDTADGGVADTGAGGGVADGVAAAVATEWRRMAPIPGKLFVVGDPKQSIYRFRRADIAALQEVRQLLGAAAQVSLSQNFRSQESIIGWVNQVFAAWMAGGGTDETAGAPALQAAYENLAAFWEPPPAQPPLGVHRMGGPVAGGADAARREEAQAIASLVRDMAGPAGGGAGGWQVRRELKGPLFEAQYQDICLLLPARTTLPYLEQTLESAAVPYRIESQSLVLNTQDVRELLNCLRAIDSPADQVALIAALRSSAFGCSDIELLQFYDDGGRFDYFSPGQGGGPVAEGLAVLREFHERRAWDDPAELIERFIRERRMVEAAFGRPRPRERWRRLRFVAEQCRAFAQANSGGHSLRRFLDWMERQAAEGFRTIETPAPETDEDCVRIMTVHAAKGLEFPIVILAGLGGARPYRANPALFDRGGGPMQVRIGSDGAGGGGRFETPHFAEAAEREQQAEEAERVRLAYVAATRARDHLVVSLFRPEKRSEKSPAAILESLSESAPHLWREVDEYRLAHPRPSAPPPPAIAAAPDDFALRRAQWQTERAAVIAQAQRPQAQAVTAVTRLEKDEPESGEAFYYRRGRGGAPLGRAVHTVLQTVDLDTGDGLRATSQAQAAAEEIPAQADEVAALAQAALESAIVRRAADGRRDGQAAYYREVFISAPLPNGTLMEGFIDLLLDEPEGLTIIDYKTDSVETPEDVEQAAQRHATQMGLYAWAAGQVTGKPVRQAVLLFLRPSREHIFDDIPALTEQALAAVEGRD